MRRSLVLSLALTVWLLAGCAGQRPGHSAPDGPASGHRTGSAIHGTVTGVVTGTGDEPISGAMVEVTSLDEPARPIPDIAVITDGGGRYSWSLPPGRYRLSVRQAHTTVTVTAGETVQADLRLS